MALRSKKARREKAPPPLHELEAEVMEEIWTQREATVRTVLRFLEVDDTYPVQTLDANPTILMRSQQLDDLVHAVTVGRGPVSRMAKSAVKAILPRGARHGALGVTRRHVVHGDPKTPDEELMLELRRRFKPEVVAASDYLGRDLVSLWGYDGLD